MPKTRTVFCPRPPQVRSHRSEAEHGRRGDRSAAAFRFLAHDFVTEGAHAAEAEGLSRIILCLFVATFAVPLALVLALVGGLASRFRLEGWP